MYCSQWERTSFSAVAAPAINLNAQTMDCSIRLAFIRFVTKPRLSEQSAVCTRTQTCILSNRRNTIFLTTTFAWRRFAGTMNIIKQLAPEVVYIMICTNIGMLGKMHIICFVPCLCTCLPVLLLIASSSPKRPVRWSKKQFLHPHNGYCV